MMFLEPHQSSNDIRQLSRKHLESVVRLDSSSDERSETIPSTVGQVRLSEQLSSFFADLGYRVEMDSYANLIATIPGRGTGSGRTPLAFLIHLDTARGTHAVEELNIGENWDGSPLPFPMNDHICVDMETYPSLRQFLGHDIIYGPGDAPFGLDDKLGLTHMMTLAWLLHTNPAIPHPPLLLIGRPDEEIGRMEALVGLASTLAKREVRRGFTIDGIFPFEINLENFNASHGTVRFPSKHPNPAGGMFCTFFVGGVNTHGATAKDEGHRGAPRLCAELVHRLEKMGLAPEAVRPTYWKSDAERDCDAVIGFQVTNMDVLKTVENELAAVIAPHARRGASWKQLEAAPREEEEANEAVMEALRFITTFLSSSPGFVLAAEESDGRNGYSQPFRLRNDGDSLLVDVRIRDFDAEGLSGRENHLREAASAWDVEIQHQYTNMGLVLKDKTELLEWPLQAGATIGVECPVQPIRGGTGVDPFLEAGVAIGNLGTGYFAPESEKELTSLQLMEEHARWLIALVQIAAR